MRNSLDLGSTENGECQRLKSLSKNHCVKSNTKYLEQKASRNKLNLQNHRGEGPINCSYRRKYFWKYKVKNSLKYVKKKIKKTNKKDSNLKEKQLTKTNALDANYIGYVKESKQTRTKSLTDKGGTVPVLDVQNLIECALNTETTKLKSSKQKASGIGNRIV